MSVQSQKNMLENDIKTKSQIKRRDGPSRSPAEMKGNKTNSETSGYSPVY